MATVFGTGLFGTPGDDVLEGTPQNDQIYALAGNDRLLGSAGSDLLDGGPGSDTVDYSRLNGSVQLDLGAGSVGKGIGGMDTLISIGNAIGSRFGDSLFGNADQNHLQGGAGNDFLWGGAGADRLDGGPGSDTVSYAGSPAGVRVDLAAGTARDGYGFTDTIISIGLADGSAHADTLLGNDNLNVLRGGDGNDRLFGRGGDDTLVGGQGDDLLDGGEGSDTVSYFDDPSGVIVDLGQGTATDGWGGQDTIVSAGHVIGTPEHADVLIGNDNVNIINGGGGGDTLTGRGGADTFVMNSWDWWGSTITDFEPGIDKISIDLGSIPVTGYSRGQLDASRFTTDELTSGEWTFLYDQDSGEVLFDIDGTGPDTALTVVTLANAPDVSAGDFLLA